MSSMTLYDAAEELRTLFDTLDGLEDPQQIAEFEKEMEPVFARALAKVEAFAGFLRHLDSQAELCAAEVKRITAAKKRFEAMKERLETYAIRAMQANGVSRMDAATVSLRLQQNPPSVVIEDGLALDERFFMVQFSMRGDLWARARAVLQDWADSAVVDAIKVGEVSTPIKSAIAAAIKAGEEVPGARLERGVRLVVK